MQTISGAKTLYTSPEGTTILRTTVYKVGDEDHMIVALSDGTLDTVRLSDGEITHIRAVPTCPA